MTAHVITFVVVMKQVKVCWLSAGISSFVAGMLSKDVDLWIYIDIEDQHPDSMRFIRDCERVIGQKVIILRPATYHSVEDCVLAFGGFRNPHNSFAPCTNWMKKRVRKEWEEKHKDDVLTYVWGFDLSEKARAERTIEANPQAQHEFPLIENGLSKREVHGYFEMHYAFKRPLMYEMGYPNNNCIGCIKGGMGYWNHIRKDFPEVFAKRAALERQVGHSILKECYLDELDPTKGRLDQEIFPECGIMCYFPQLLK